MSEPIPGPKGLPFVGNLLDLQDEVPLHAIERISDIHGPLFKLKFPGGGYRYFCTGYELSNELCDETRFYKIAPKALQGLGKGGHAGLFTAATEKDMEWQIAHRVLMPAFGPMAIEDMFDAMYDIACQLTLKWARLGPDKVVAATSDFTRLTLDTIALCTMDYRFNSFYQDEMHPFVAAMTRMLRAGSEANQLSGMLKGMLPSHAAALKRDKDLQRQTAEEIVEKRKNNPVDKKDLLNAMIYNKDPKTGQNMSPGLIAANMQTFLIAGHETTSGLLSFAFALMLKNPATLFRAQQEIDEVVGTGKITAKHLNQLPYITAVLRETLRLYPTAPAFNRGQRPENAARDPHPTIGGGRFEVPDIGITCLTTKIHRDPVVWGADADEFSPERMMHGKFENLPRNAWMPFGTGSRACIGRSFAWQEAMLVVTMILQNFDLRLRDPHYEIKVDQTLTIKPRDFEVYASLRTGLTATALQDRLTSDGPARHAATNETEDSQSIHDPQAGRPVQIMYGTTTGTTQALASKLAATLSGRGWATSILDMDVAVKKINTDALQIIITSSYEGMPPDNANLFVNWIQSIKDANAFSGVDYAVFGCGHSDWRHTFQRIPTVVDEAMAATGAKRICERGSSDAVRGDITGQFDEWMKNQLLPAITSSTDGAASIGDEQDEPVISLCQSAPTGTVDSRLARTKSPAAQLQHKAVVKTALRLTPPGLPEKRHLEIKLPPEVTYSVGDYLMVLPRNSEEQINRVAKHFSVAAQATITISHGGSTTLPVNAPLPVSELLGDFVELTQPASKSDVAKLAQKAKASEDKQFLQFLASDEEAYALNVSDKRISVLDLLERFSSIDLSFAAFLALLPSMKSRLYSISSSALASPDKCTISYSVIDAPHLSSQGLEHEDGSQHRFQGVAGNFLRKLKAGDQIQVATRSSNKFFRLPNDMSTTPMVMICAGTGIAPFRGFIQERAVMIEEGHRALSPALLFVGCRAPVDDQLYKKEFDEWQRIGAVEVRYAFSRDSTASQGCKYVQDRVWHDREDVTRMWREGAKFYVCGSREMSKDLREVATKLITERRVNMEGGQDITEADAEAWLEQMRNQRFVSDIFT